MDIGDLSDLILQACGGDRSLVVYNEADPFTTKVKLVDSSKAIRDLGHDPLVDIHEGLVKYVAWMKATLQTQGVLS